MYRIFKVEGFDKKIKRVLNKIEISELNSFLLELRKNPYLGKQLTYPFFREKKMKNKRIYYLIYENILIILLVAISSKKDQQNTINIIKKSFKKYLEIAENLSKKTDVQ